LTRLRGAARICGRFVAELLRELSKFLFGSFELELELSHVDALGLGDEDASPQELKLLQQLSISVTQVVALARHAGESLARCGEFFSRCRELPLHAPNESLKLFHAR
jgi:hypothetical protein